MWAARDAERMTKIFEINTLSSVLKVSLANASQVYYTLLTTTDFISGSSAAVYQFSIWTQIEDWDQNNVVKHYRNLTPTILFVNPATSTNRINT